MGAFFKNRHVFEQSSLTTSFWISKSSVYNLYPVSENTNQEALLLLSTDLETWPHPFKNRKSSNKPSNIKLIFFSSYLSLVRSIFLLLLLFNKKVHLRFSSQQGHHSRKEMWCKSNQQLHLKKYVAVCICASKRK